MAQRSARTRLLHALAAVSSIAACALPAEARAYCRSSDEVGDYGECVQAPNAPFLFWKRACSTYRFNQDFFKQLAPLREEEQRHSFRVAFETWAAVDCSGRAPFFVEQLTRTTEVDRGEYLRDKPEQNESVVLAFDTERWTALPDHSSRAIALTLIWHSKRTGEILDWDMELNLGAGQFADCVDHRCEPGMVDLQNTVTHEAGHVLGLGHSLDPDSTMAAQTVGEVDLQKRTLAADDEAGYCALMLPESPCQGDDCSCDAADSGNSEPQSSDGPARESGKCQVLAPGVTSSSAAAWLLLWAAAVCITRRRAAHATTVCSRR